MLSMAHSTFTVGDLTAVIGDNAAHEQHRPGYEGVWSPRCSRPQTRTTPC